MAISFLSALRCDGTTRGHTLPGLGWIESIPKKLYERVRVHCAEYKDRVFAEAARAKPERK